MSRRPCLSCCFSGRSAICALEGERTEGAVAVAVAVAEEEETAEVAALEGSEAVFALVAAARTALVMGVPLGFGAVDVAVDVEGVDVDVDGVAAFPPSTGDGFAVGGGIGCPMGVS